MIVLVTMHQCFVHVHAIYFCTFFVFCTFFLALYVYYVFLLWAASYEGLMPPLAACHIIYVMYLANKLSLSLMARNSRCSDSIGSSMDLSPWAILILTDQRQHRTRGQSNIYDYLVCFEPNIKSYSTHTPI